MRRRLWIILLAVLLPAAAAGCGTLYPRSTITGGDAAGSVNRDEVLDVQIEPIKPMPPSAPASKTDNGEWVVEILEEN